MEISRSRFEAMIRDLIMPTLDAMKTALDEAGLTPGDIHLLVPHQANARIITAIAERMGLAEDKISLNIDQAGNTLAASIPIALDQAVRAGRIQQGDRLILASFGAGLTWAGTVLRL